VEGKLHAALASTIRELIERVTNGQCGEAFARAAHKYNALPLAEGWFAWALITEQGEVLEGSEDGSVSPAVEPLRTMFLVAGAERFPELTGLLPVRPAASIDCTRCEGTGRMQHGSGRIRCQDCRSLGWVEMPSNP
jgi:hypothetical protein